MFNNNGLQEEATLEGGYFWKRLLLEEATFGGGYFLRSLLLKQGTS